MKKKNDRNTDVTSDTDNKGHKSHPVIREMDLYRLVLDSIPIRVFWKDNNCVYLGANRAFLNDCNIDTHEQIVGKTDYDFPWEQEEADAFVTDDQQVMSLGQAKLNIIEPQTHADGNTTWLRTNKVPLRDENGLVIGILGTYENITDRKLKAEALARSEARFRAVVNQTYQFIGLLDINGRVLMVNDTVADRFHIKPQDSVGEYFPDTPFWPESEKVKVIDAIHRARKGEFVRFKTYHIVPCGSTIFIDFSLKPVFDQDGQVESLLPEGRDITDQVLAEQQLKELNEQLEQRVEERTKQLKTANNELSEALDAVHVIQDELAQSEKLASIGSLVSSFTHDMNTPIGIGITATSLIDEKVKNISRQLQESVLTQEGLENDLSQLEESIALLTCNLQRASELVKGFKQVSIDQASEALREIELNQYLSEIIISLRPRLRHALVDVNIDVAPDIYWTTYPGMVAQVITNLVMNSLDHAFAGIESPVISLKACRNNNSIELCYQDNGCGMSESVLQRMYEPFYTTRRDKGGSGVGMHTVYNLVTDKLAGKLECRSVSGEGTLFNITLPLHEPNCNE